MTARPIYMDYNAHAPMDPAVRERMAWANVELDANPHAAGVEGEAAAAAIGEARAQIAALIGSPPNDIVFTSGATEANNLALLGIADHLAAIGRRTLVVGAGEHPSVLRAADHLAGRGFDVRLAPLQRDGLVDLDRLGELLDDTVGLVSVAAANHEVGAVQPLLEISTRTRAAGALLHSDLAQAASKVPIEAAWIDLGSLSAHKLGGPTGVGALYVSRSLRRAMRALQHGGGQEGGLRSGTLSAALCVGFGAACAISRDKMSAEAARVSRLRDQLRDGLLALGGVFVNGGMTHRLPGNLNVSIAGVDAEALVLKVRSGLSIATGSACTAQSIEPSHVLLALGLDRSEAEASVRISLGRFTTREEVGEALVILEKAIGDLRSLVARASYSAAAE